jgi:hypothetical protein
MNVFRAALFLTAVAAAILSSSCVNSREEYWIDARGGGRGEMTFTLPAAALRLHGGVAGVEKMIDSFLKEIPGIEATRREVTVNGDRAEVALAFRFDSALDLTEFAESPAMRELPSAVTHLTGHVDVSLRGRELTYTRRSDPGRAIPGVSLLPASRRRPARHHHPPPLPRQRDQRDAYGKWRPHAGLGHAAGGCGQGAAGDAFQNGHPDSLDAGARCGSAGRAGWGDFAGAAVFTEEIALRVRGAAGIIGA